MEHIIATVPAEYKLAKLLRIFSSGLSLFNMPRATQFNSDWFSVKDQNGHLIKEWCQTENGKDTAFCFLCKKSLAKIHFQVILLENKFFYANLYFNSKLIVRIKCF